MSRVITRVAALGLALALIAGTTARAAELKVGDKAPPFSLVGSDGKTYSLAEVRGPKGMLVVFICNHCPYVKASITRIVAEANALREIGIGAIAIMPNDTGAYPEDSFDNMQGWLFTGNPAEVR